MAKFVEAKLKGDIDARLVALEKAVQEKVLISGVASMAKVIYEEVQLNASPPKLGRKTGNLLAAIYRVFSPELSTDARKTYRISWNHRKAPHGHLLEFGTKRAPAYPFLRPSFARIGAAIQAGQERMRERLKEIS